ncbi:hypothetical protein O181_033668 [Austropuccinia psidii MF-1]|uniref:Uncharacterized protein n=1 Tax=Austropuccinia psidii MF-1 TaxID=1389203 RepID=A0A9Q3D1Y4_9BASI|nr:hypothetical protein [Austropuccinia psidii MF-1]
MLWHPRHALMISLQHCQPISTLTHSYASTPPCLTILTLLLFPHDLPLELPPHVYPHPQSLPCLRSCTTLKIWVQHCHLSLQIHTPPHLLRGSPLLRSHISSIGYGDLLAYVMHPIT